MAASTTRLDTVTRTWIASAVGCGSRVIASRRLRGGLTSAMHMVLVENARGDRHRLVVRRWAHTPPSHGERHVHREAQVLADVASSDVPAPRLVAHDAQGRATGGVPALLMTYLPGRVHLRPQDPEQWLRSLAQTLATIHAFPAPGTLPVPDEPWPVDLSAVGSWSTDAEAWRRLASLAVLARPQAQAGLLHGDFQHFNVLWSHERIVGVVDWVSAGRGPAEYDVGHAALNLSVLFATDWAIRFRQAYEAETGRRMDALCEARAVLGYDASWQSFIPIQVAGQVNVDVSGMHARVDQLVADLLRRIGN
jgi:aminoglycoside phosphotransferase (APT) family kinase protein